MISNNINHSLPSATSPNLRSWLLGTLNYARLSTWSRSGNARCVLSIASTGVIYCTCGHLMTKDSAENRKYISAVLDTFSHTELLHPESTVHTVTGMEKHLDVKITLRRINLQKCRKKKYDSIHDIHP